MTKKGKKIRETFKIFWGNKRKRKNNEKIRCCQLCDSIDLIRLRDGLFECRTCKSLLLSWETKIKGEKNGKRKIV